MTQIKIAAPWRRYTNGAATIQVNECAYTVRGALDTLTAQYPTLGARLFDGQGQVKTQIRIFRNSEDIRALNGLETDLHDGDRVVLLPAA